jgi:hypothetical protein
LDLEAILPQVEAWVRKIGRMQLERLRQKDFKVTCKSSAIDLVTEVDQVSEERLPVRWLLGIKIAPLGYCCRYVVGTRGRGRDR